MGGKTVACPRPQYRHAATVMLCVGLPASAACDRINFGAGIVHIAPHSTSSPLVISEIGGQPVSMTQSGTGFAALSADTLLLVAECQNSDHLKFRFAFGVPPTHELAGTGSLASAGVVGKGQQWSPTLLAIYSFGQTQVGLQPFVGAGFNYTWFKRARITNDEFRRTTFGPDSTISVQLTRTWNPVATAGLSWKAGDNYTLQAALSYLPLKTQATLDVDNTALGVPMKVNSELKNRSIATSVTLNYSWGR